jgi:hypothetical protein
MESGAEHREVPKEHATVKPIGGLRKRHRGWKLAAECRQEPKNGPGEIVDPGRNWPPPAERWPAMQECCSARETSPGRIRLGTKLPEELQKDGRSGRDINRNRNANLELRTEVQDGSCLLTIRRQPAESSERLSDWRLWSEQLDLLLGYEKSWIWHCWGVGPLWNGKRNRTRSMSRKCGGTGHSATAAHNINCWMAGW